MCIIGSNVFLSADSFQLSKLVSVQLPILFRETPLHYIVTKRAVYCYSKGSVASLYDMLALTSQKTLHRFHHSREMS